MSHIPVMLGEVLHALKPKDAEVYLDGTFGAGGYSHAILEAANCNLIALDRDPNVSPFVQKISAKFGERFRFEPVRFSKLEQALAGKKIDGVVLDIGVSSMQIDEADRGFSFAKNGPLDMRMNTDGPSALEAIKYLSHSELVAVFKLYGEEKRAKRCADFIARAREEETIMTTLDLAGVIELALGRSGKKHPATKVFQALRIFINDELGELVKALKAAERVLKPGGRLVVVSFHSLEDRLVKQFFRERSGYHIGGSRYAPEVKKDMRAPSFKLLKKSGITPSKEEIRANPRARSSRLRFGIRTEAPAMQKSSFDNALSVFDGLPTLDDLKSRLRKAEGGQ